MEKATQSNGEWSGFTASPIAPAPLQNVREARSGTVNRYTGPPAMNPSTSRERIPVEESAEGMVDGSCLYCFGFNHIAAEWAARQKAQTFKTAGGNVHDGRTGAGSKESEKD